MTTSYSENSRSGLLQISTGAANGAKRAVPCTVGRMERSRLSIEAKESLPASTALTVEFNDALFLGEVVSCTAASHGWKLEIRVEQVLTGLESLVALRSRLLCENAQVGRELGRPHHGPLTVSVCP